MDKFKVQTGQIRQLIASIVWTHKIQEKQSEICERKYKALSIIQILVLSLTSSGIFTIIFIDEFWLKLIAAILSAISLFITIYGEGNDFKRDSETYKHTATALFMLRENVISLLSDIKCEQFGYEEIITNKNNLYKEYFRICKESKSASTRAVKLASKDLKIRKDNTFNDDEIDSFLPSVLRISKEDK